VIVLHSLEDLSRHREAAGAGVFVPTMGALHAGHSALVVRAAELAAQRGLSAGCIASIFVNPTQFNDPADFQRYPKTLDADLEACRVAGARAVFCPSVSDIYPSGALPEALPLPSVATEPGLEDRFRPGHFAGVCQVVHRLFDLVRPAAAVFGEKDWQQLQVISAMTRERRLGVEIVPHQTIREPDGLAMSSRNRFLGAEDRRRGLALRRALLAARLAKTPEEAETLMCAELAKDGITEPDYAVVRDAQTLLPSTAGPWRALITARIGSVRLLDNLSWTPRS
jgi:pantoate--beta-alanine ligase